MQSFHSWFSFFFSQFIWRHASPRFKDHCFGAQRVPCDMVSIFLPHHIGFRWAAGSWAAKSSPRRNKKRIVSKSRCCFTVIFCFHNFAGEKYICMAFRDTVAWVSLLRANLTMSPFPQKFAGFTFPKSRKSQPLAHQRGQPLGSYLFSPLVPCHVGYGRARIAMPRRMRESTRIHATGYRRACASVPRQMRESTCTHAAPDTGEHAYPCHTGYGRVNEPSHSWLRVQFWLMWDLGSFVAVKKWQVLVLVAWHGLVERRVQRPWGSLSATPELLSLWQGPRSFRSFLSWSVKLTSTWLELLSSASGREAELQAL